MLRILRIRTMLEEIAQAKLEKQAAELSRIHNAAELQQRLALSSRRGALALLDGKAVPADEWLVRVTDVEFFAWKQRRLADLLATQKPAVEGARQELLGRRLERLQMEALVAWSLRTEAQDRLHREQKQADDWFQAQISRRVRRRS